MFSERKRSELRDQLVAAARLDGRIAAAALVGSTAGDREDRWSGPLEELVRTSADMPSEVTLPSIAGAADDVASTAQLGAGA